MNSTDVNKHSALSGDDNLGQLPGKNPKEDLELRRLIKAGLEKQCGKDAADVQISVKDCFVSLTGFVETNQVRDKLIKIVEETDGVEDVVSLIEVRSSGQNEGVPSPS